MDESFANLYSVLTESEKLLCEEQDKIRKAKDEIEQTKVKTQKELTLIAQNKGKIRTLEKKVNGVIAEIKTSTAQIDTLSKSILDLQKENKEQSSILQELTQANESIILTFMNDTASFSKEFGLGEGNRKTRFSQAKEKTQELYLQKQDIENDIEQLEEKIKDIETANEKLNHVNKCFTDVSSKIEALTAECSNEQADLDKLEQEGQLLEEFESDPRFLSLQTELESLNLSSLELKAKALQQEKENLGQQLAEKERQQAQQQHNQWARSRKRWAQQADS